MQNTDWHLMHAEDVVRAFSSDMYTGLPAKKRRGRNRIWYVPRASAAEYALACFSDLASLLLVVTAVFAAILILLNAILKNRRS